MSQQFPISLIHPLAPGKILHARDQRELGALQRLGWKPQETGN